jgi:RNA polymerase sigma factor (sigma-70 family)
MLGDPDDASDAVQDTFVIAASRLGDLSDARKLRPWLYAVARNECQLRLDGTEPGLEGAGDLDDPYPDTAGRPDQAELREFVRTALDGLKPAEREVIELDLRHDLHGADLAAVLGIPRNQAHELATGARGQLERGLGALLVARTGRRACPDLDMLLDGWDGELTPPDRKQIDRHIDQCDICADRIEGALRPAMQHGMVPLFGPPLELRDEVLQLCTSSSPGALSYRRDVTQRAGPFRENGFPEPIRPPRRRVLALSGMTAAVAAVVIAITATGIVAAIALTGSHPRHPATAAAQSSQSSTTATGGTVPASTDPAGGLPSGAQPTTSVTTTASTAPPAPAPSPTRPARPKPSPSRPATSAAPLPSRPKFTYTPTPTATPTVSVSAPSTGTTPPG